MDKNMINIDDLLKQRLPYGEERQRPGAWLQMRELLDQQMPVTAVPTAGAAFNWRRMFSYLAGLALLATVSIGSYQVATSYRSDDATSQEAARVANSTAGSNSVAYNTENTAPANTASSSTNTTANTNADHGSTHTAATSSNNPTNANSNNGNNRNSSTTASIAASNSSGNDENTGNTNTSQKSQPQVIANNTAKSPAIAATTNTQKTSTSGHDNVLVDNNKQTAAKAIASSKAKTLTTGSEMNGQQQLPVQQMDKPVAERNFASGAKAGINLPGADKPAALQTVPRNTAKQTQEQANIPAPNSGAGAKTGGNIAVNNNNTTKPQTTKLIDKVETKETYDRIAGWRKDTVATGKVEWSSNEPAMMLANNTLSSNAVPADVSMIPNASAVASSSETADNEALVPLANFKVESKKSHYAKARKFEQMMQNAKTNMGTIRFYPGLILGGNTTTGNNSMSGFQFGVTGMLSLNEKWGILSELKYMQRFKRDSRIQDNYTTAPTPYAFLNGGTVYKYNSVENTINYSTISSLELPIALNYSAKRFNFLGGVNLAYNFNIAGVDAKPLTTEQYTAPLSTAEIPETTARLNGQATLSESDFKARTSLGYLLGAAYQITPAFKLDLRMTQNLMDNAKSTGAKKISKELYRSPSLQLNLNYRFSSNKNRPAKAR